MKIDVTVLNKKHPIFHLNNSIDTVELHKITHGFWQGIDKVLNTLDSYLKKYV